MGQSGWRASRYAWCGINSHRNIGRVDILSKKGRGYLSRLDLANQDSSGDTLAYSRGATFTWVYVWGSRNLEKDDTTR